MVRKIQTGSTPLVGKKSKSKQIAGKYRDVYCPERKRHNRLVAKTILRYAPGRPILILDAEKMRTYDALTNVMDLADGQLHAPNLDPVVVANLRKNPGVVAEHAEVEQYIRQNNNVGFRAAYLDLMGAVTGNATRGIYPAACVDQFLKQKNVPTGTVMVLGVTVSRRNNTHKHYCGCDTPKSCISQADLTREIFTNIFKANGYNIVTEKADSRGKNMLFFLWTLIKSDNVDGIVKFRGTVLPDGSQKFVGFPPHYVE